jgi:hypothetical protein
MTGLALALLLGMLGAPPSDDLVGTSREEIVALLGRPTKAEFSKSGEKLLYRLVRPEGDIRSDPDLLLVELPGIGLVGRRLSELAGPEGRQTTLEPTTVDEQGRSVSGGMTDQESRSITWSKEEGKVVTPDQAGEAPALRRVKLTLWLDSNGRVASWSLDPPPKKKGS